MPDVKFCGLTRVEDAAHAARLGADYLGVILAPSAREVSLLAARELFRALGAEVRRIGVFVSPTLDVLARAVEALDLHAVQVHGALPEPPGPLRTAIGADVWAVAGVSGGLVDLAPTALACDVVLFDTSVGGRTGGSGETFPWESVRAERDRVRRITRVAVAGGLRPDNVGRAIAVLAPDIVNVSSGVESRPGCKDHELMSAFYAAAKAAQPA